MLSVQIFSVFHQQFVNRGLRRPENYSVVILQAVPACIWSVWNRNIASVGIIQKLVYFDTKLKVL